MEDKIILNHRIADLIYTESTNIVEERWKRSSMNASDEEFKEYQKIKVQILDNYNPKFFFCNSGSQFHALSQELQQWTHEVVMKFWEKKPLKKFAIVPSRQQLCALSMKIALEIGNHNYPIEFFQEEEKAKRWLLAS